MTGLFEERVSYMERNMSTMHKDFLLTHLRSHTEKLRGLLEQMESECFDLGFLKATLKDAETHLKRIRKVCEVCG